jgi:restriction endonuclease S subunit
MNITIAGYVTTGYIQDILIKSVFYYGKFCNLQRKYVIITSDKPIMDYFSDFIYNLEKYGLNQLSEEFIYCVVFLVVQFTAMPASQTTGLQLRIIG